MLIRKFKTLNNGFRSEPNNNEANNNIKANITITPKRGPANKLEIINEKESVLKFNSIIGIMIIFAERVTLIAVIIYCFILVSFLLK